MKKAWGIITYILLISVIIGTIKAIFVGDIRLIVKSLVYIPFTTSLVLQNKLTNKNKVVEIIFWISSGIIIFYDYFLQLFL
ncbi:hypothetical protein [Clostridium paraputrificum]|uniref:hypothetical protein n=1 Tax=Clostridium paraputrificum TaxID=29363 RepID=UPI00066630FE|nr:hypothetical protein [Clostridium paraputrificum]MDB2107412.1 hypothetical protein [Clostridium paraputrificum]MDB2114076.1 hypothetical protein [Clostridium paraputrificum]MDU3323602.1 hypothetical protein [Escherichia coli]